MKTKLWVTLHVPVEVAEEGNGIPIAQTALDTAWERITDTNEPPEGLIECVRTVEQWNAAPETDCVLMNKAA